jgi:hypothetical protein
MVNTAYAQTNTNPCEPKPIVFAFFNGVQTTEDQAYEALNKMKALYGESMPSSTNGEKIQYELMYNYTKGFEDFVETFDQRLKEHIKVNDDEYMRYELFFQAIKGNGSWLDKLKNRIPAYANLFANLPILIRAAATKALVSLSGTTINTSQNYAEHTARIDNWAMEGRKMLFVAHSQGNLFANAAYDYTKAIVGEQSVKVVHIAPASVVLNGPHTLVSKDIVIIGLFGTGKIPTITTPISTFLFRPAGLNGKTDPLGHGLLEIYLNPKLSAASLIKNHIDTALKTLVAPIGRVKAGLFTVSLKWNGIGDVDLHVREAQGWHVYFGSREGDAGYLDLDNTRAYGPEHYYASCDAGKVVPGNYKISLANYSKAQGKQATVQISSAADGVLGTKTVTMGAETGRNPSIDVFNVLVGINKGQYSITLN